MIGTQSQLVAVLVAEDRGNGHAATVSGTQGINVIQLAQIRRDLAGFPVYLVEIILVFLVILADFKLDPAIIARTLFPGAASPGPVIPGHGLYGGDSPVRLFADPAVHPGFPGDMVPVVVVDVLSQLFQPFSPIRGVVAGLDISFEVRIAAAGIVPKHALDLHFPRASVTGALRLHTNQGRILFTVFHAVPSLQTIRAASFPAAHCHFNISV